MTWGSLCFINFIYLIYSCLNLVLTYLCLIKKYYFVYKHVSCPHIHYFFFTTSTFFRILFKLFFMFTTGANFFLSWTGNCSSSCVMHLMGLLNILIWLDGSFQCLWLVFEGLFNLHWTDVTDAFHNMLLLKFNDWDEPFVLLNILWMTMLTGILDHSVVYIDQLT